MSELSKPAEENFVEVQHLEGMLGCSPRMREAFALIRRMAPYFRAALIVGETGTGKELVARALHKLSPRKDRPFIRLDCGAILESPTGWQPSGRGREAAKYEGSVWKGVFKQVYGGTVFLDEIGDLPSGAQSSLLQFLDRGEVQDSGPSQPQPSDLAVIAASSRGLEQDIRERRFRLGLWYRLKAAIINLPRLRERAEDILPLAQDSLGQFHKRYGTPPERLSRGAQNALLAYPWPGNVRELEAVIERTCMLTQGTIIDFEDLPHEVRNPFDTTPGTLKPFEESEKDTLIRILRENPNKTLAARKLGIGRSTIYHMLKKYQIEPLDGSWK